MLNVWRLNVLALGMLLTMTSAANASPICTTEPTSRWLPKDEMKTQIKASGYIIAIFKTTKGNCYEIYGRTQDGRLAEVYYNPVTGVVVKETVR